MCNQRERLHRERGVMRLLKQQEHWVPQFTQVWEVEVLAEQGEHWVPFCRVGEREPIGSIHARTHEIRVSDGVVVSHRQVVALAAPHSSTETAPGPP